MDKEGNVLSIFFASDLYFTLPRDKKREGQNREKQDSEGQMSFEFELSADDRWMGIKKMVKQFCL